MTEVDFPRGRYATFNDSTAKKGTKRLKEDELFSTQAHDEKEDGKIDSKPKSTKRKRNRKTEDDVLPGVPTFNEKIHIYRLKVFNVAINSTALGCITETKDYEMSVQLPGPVLVRVAINNISESYNKSLLSYALDPANNPSPPKPKSLFMVGDLLPVKILDKKETNMQYEDVSVPFTEIEASVNPRDVYSDLNPGTFINNCLNTSISAAVVDIEDHGYTMDVGFENVTGFLDFEEAKPFIEARKMDKLYVGQVVFCNIISATKRVIKLSTKSSTKTPNFEDSAFPISCLLPGVQVTAKIIAKFEKGLEVVIFGQHRGFVHRDHLKTIWDLPLEDYTIGSEVKGMVLFVNPLTKIASISVRSSSDMANLKKSWKGFKIGQLIEKAQIVGKDTNDSLIFKLPNGFKGVAPKGELTDGYLAPDDFAIIENQMPIGSSHKCRIKSFSYIDGYVKVTLKESLLKAEFLSIEKLAVGQVIEGTVKKLSKKGLILNLGFALKAICPPIHHKDSAKPKDYKAGSKVKCRIIRLDTQSLSPRIAVTCRKELIREANIIDDISKAKPGTFTRGIIVLIKDNGLLVEFFNELRGWLSAHHHSSIGQHYSPSAYSIGQILPVYISHHNPETKKISLHLTCNEREDSTPNPDALPLGTILTNLTVSKKTSKGLRLTSAEGDQYILPKDQLSDFAGLMPKMFECIMEMETIDKVVVFNNSTDIPIVSRRGLFIHAAENQSPVFKPETLSSELIIPVIVKRLKVYGLIIECPGATVGLVHTNDISSDKVDPLSCGFPLQQTILVKINAVIESEGKTRRLNCCSIAKECLSPDFTPDQVLTCYLNDYSFIQSKLYNIENNSLARALSAIKPGTILPYKVLKSVEGQVLVACSREGTKKPLPGVITQRHLISKDSGKVGHSEEAVVLYVDIEKKLLHLSADPDLRKRAAKAAKGMPYEKVKPGQIMNSQVELISDKFYIVSLKGHGDGVLAYIPRYFHLNAVRPEAAKLAKKTYFEVKSKVTTENGTVLIVGSRTNDKPTSVQVKEKKAKKAKLEKQKRKLELLMGKKGAKSTVDQASDAGDYEDDENDDEAFDEEIHSDSEKEDNENIEEDDTNDPEETQEDVNKEDASEESDPELKFARFFIDRKGFLRCLKVGPDDQEKENGLQEIEVGEASSSDDSYDGEADEIKIKIDREAEKRKRKLSVTDETSLKKQREKHFKQLQSQVSDRVRSAVSNDSDISFFWDIKGNNDSGDEQIDYDEPVPSIQVEKVVGHEEEDEDEEDLDDGTGPLTKQEFEKLIVESPNDIDRWCRYIGYYLRKKEVNQAKELCERALETIDHKLEANKLRIWLLKLRIEFKHGTPESMDEQIKKALCANDEWKVFQGLIKLYSEEDKTELVEQVYREATKKCPLNKQIWIDFGRFYLEQGRPASFRDLFQKCITYMDKKEQLDIIIKFAQLECQQGDLERAKTMFEATLANFPKRVDIWSIYLDMMIKYGLKPAKGAARRGTVESIRLLFERATSIKVKEKKIQFLFNKYLDFEKQFGDEERIALIKKKLSEYVGANDLAV